MAEFAAESGTAVPCAGNRPVEMDDPRFVWFIDEGAVDLFLVERRVGVEQSAPQHLLRADAGRLLPGVAPQEAETALALVAKGLPGTVLRRLPAASLGAIRPAELARHVDAWIGDVSAILSRDVTNRPRPDTLVAPGADPDPEGGTLSARRGVVWVSEPPPGAGLFLSLIDPAESGPGVGAAPRPLPLTPSSWLALAKGVALSTCSSESLAEEGLLLPALESFHATAFSVERLNRRLAVVDQANVARERVNNRRGDEEGARRRLFNLYGLAEEEDAGAGDSALREALQVIGRHEGIEFQWPVATEASDTPPALADILDASGVRGRRVRLPPDERWWVGASGAMLAFREEDGRPVALLPSAFGSYREVDPAGKGGARVTAERAAFLKADGWLFYRPLPAAAVGVRELLKFAGKGLAPDVVRFVTAGLLVGFVMLLPPVVFGFLADAVIPVGATGTLHAATGALAAFALLGGLLHVFQGMALMRLEGRAASRVEAAFWDRLLRLPPRVLHRYPAGELAMRGTTFQGLRDSVQGVVANAVLSIVFLAPALALVFFYDAALGVLAAVFGVLSLAVTVGLGLRQMTPHGRVIRSTQALAGRLFQLINGIARLRIGSAEGSAFAVWARDYREQMRAELDRGAIETHLVAFSAALPLLAGAVLVLGAARSEPGALSVGDFLVAFTLLMLFQAAVVRLGASFGAVAAIIPAMDQVRPFLGEPPETGVEGDPVGNLGGEVVFDHVSFRHHPDGPLILDDVSIRARPGEFVAIAGESGAGKSTLFRLALGLAQPSAGAVYYDGRDLRRLNVKQVRRQIGVVPQEVQLHPQDLWDNIIGDHEDATADDAWRAARLAAVDEDIAAMPMGMLTPVGASASVTSGGESQRILIAHALVHDPRILLLDEATNWLDNDAQARIMANLAALSSTRIVIAHRLSTLRHADRIYVLRSGKVVQEGAFAELAGTEGVFRDLVRRQMA